MKRRDFIKTTGLAGLGLAAGCSAPAPPGVVFKGWAYEPDLVRENIEFFERQSGVQVAYEAVSGSYHDKMVALLVGQTPVDCCYVRDDDFAEWVEAGWLRPCDDLPGAGQDEGDIFGYNLEAMTYGGKRYGLPYYTDFTIWIYNQPMLQSAGFEQPATTLEELTEQAVKIKELRIAVQFFDHGAHSREYCRRPSGLCPDQQIRPGMGQQSQECRRSRGRTAGAWHSRDAKPARQGFQHGAAPRSRARPARHSRMDADVLFDGALSRGKNTAGMAVDEFSRRQRRQRRLSC